MLGAEHFYLYNNLSHDHYLDVLSEYVESGLVDLIEWPFESVNVSTFVRIQCEAYQDALERCDSKWLAIIDIDEFIVPIKDESFHSFLSRFEGTNVGGLLIPQLPFGTSNIQRVPEDKLMIETLLLNGGPAFGGDLSAICNSGCAFKSIVRTKRVNSVTTPHVCYIKDGYFNKVVDYDTAQSNHYCMKDEQFLHTVKVPRQIKWGATAEAVLAHAALLNKKNQYGNRITRFVPLLRQIMGLPNEK